MSGPTSTMLIIAPDATRSRLVGNQAPPVREGVRVITITAGDRFPDRLRGHEIDTVIVMERARLNGSEALWQTARMMHRGNGPWIEMDPDFMGVMP